MPGKSSSWLLAWCDSQGFTNAWQVSKYLSVPRNRRKMQAFIESGPIEGPPLVGEPASSLATGTSMDLSGTLDCFNIDCIRKRADSMLQRTALYFDHVYIVGPSRAYLRPLFSRDPEKWKGYIVELTKLLFYLRRIGAEDLLVFGEKPPGCYVHAEQHAREVGLGPLYDSSNEWIDRFMPEAEVEPFWSDVCGHWHAAVTHPAFDHTQHAHTDAGREASNEEVLRAAVTSVFQEYSVELVRDLRFSRMVHSPLGSELAVHDEILTSGLTPLEAEPLEGDVAYRLPMPFLDSIEAKELLRIRAHEQGSFEVFRGSLRSAIQERIQVENPASADEIAIEIGNDVIGPALVEITNKLEAAERMLKRAGGIAGGLGAVTLTVGLLAGLPAVAGPLISAGLALPDVRAYLDKRREIELSEMYFLWNAIAHRH